MNDVFERIQKEYDELVKRHEEEKAEFIRATSKTLDIYLLKLCDEPNLSVRPAPGKAGENNMIVQSTRQISVQVNDAGQVRLYWDGGYVTNYYDEKFKRLYKHLADIYEEKQKARGRSKVPF